MLGRLVQKIRDNIAIHQLKGTPAIKWGTHAIRTCWLEDPYIIKKFSQQFIKNTSEKMMEKVVEIAVNSDPRMANRKFLTESIIEFAKLFVLVIDPPPIDDPTGFRGKPGITGELKAHLWELAQKDKTFREIMHRFDTPKDWNDVWGLVLASKAVVTAWMNIFQTLRFAFDDASCTEGKDWFRPYVAAMCAKQEHEYRMSLGMPPSLDDSGMGADVRALMMGSFMYDVMEGARYPDLRWQELVQKMESSDP